MQQKANTGADIAETTYREMRRVQNKPPNVESDLENPVKLRLIEGDCLKAMKLIPKKSIGILNTDPPYNIGKNYGNFKDNMEESEYWEWISRTFDRIKKLMKERGYLFISHTDRGSFILKSILDEIGFHYVQTLIWYARNGYGQRNITRWSYRCEPILYYTTIPDLELIHGDKAEWYTNILEVPRPQSNFSEGRHHPTQKPLKLYRYILQRCPANDVLDPYHGSGTTMKASLQLKKNCIGIEINPEYNQTAKRLLNWNSSLGNVDFKFERLGS